MGLFRLGKVLGLGPKGDLGAHHLAHLCGCPPCAHTREEREPSVVILVLVGLASVVFTYFGVNYLPGLHSYQ